MTALRKSGRRKGSGWDEERAMKRKRGYEGRTDGERRRNQQPLAASTWWCGARGVLNYAATLELTCRHVHRVHTGGMERHMGTRAGKCGEIFY